MQRQRVCVCWPEMVAVDEALQAQCMDVCVCVCVCVRVRVRAHSKC